MKKSPDSGMTFSRARAGLRTAVVGLHDQQVFTGWVDRRRGVEAESREGAGMLAEIVPVQPDIRDGADTVELKKVALRRGRGAAS